MVESRSYSRRRAPARRRRARPHLIREHALLHGGNEPEVARCRAAVPWRPLFLAAMLNCADTPSDSVWLAELQEQEVLFLDGLVAAFPDAEWVERRVGLFAVTRASRNLLLVGSGGDRSGARFATPSSARSRWFLGERTALANVHRRHLFRVLLAAVRILRLFHPQGPQRGLSTLLHRWSAASTRM